MEEKIKKIMAVTMQPLTKITQGTSPPAGLSGYLQWLFTFALAVAAAAAVVQIIIGGVQIMMSGANESMLASAKKRISDALWGLLLALSVWLILWTINPDLLSLRMP